MFGKEASVADQPDNIVIFSEFACIALFWVLMKYTIVLRPLRFFEILGILPVGVFAGIGIVKLWRGTFQLWFPDVMKTLVAFCMLAAIAFLCFVCAHAVYYVTTGRRLLR